MFGLSYEDMFGWAIGIACGVAYLTHIVHGLRDRELMLLLIGVFVFPLGVIRGFMILLDQDG